ncbi:hypothetical protein SAMN06295910_2613 [Allosphingosinicella indica]|uniref:Uncharacterized protein n=2 Tax=Allosphingosinicella indica TaxID=941907 RepID=A0A1X7H2A2_9SPHN|nr:hypothetical protein SAMN06295910_2613 [Allosphingosinicella indica]
MAEGMSEDSGKAQEIDLAAASRRSVLMLGAVAASTVVTVRPALAQTAGSVLNCQIPVPTPQSGGSYIAADGSLVAPGTPGAFPPARRPITGQEAKRLLNSGYAPAGMDAEASQAYANYIRRLQQGMSGFTCYASLQMSR